MLYITSLLSAILLGIVTWYVALDYRVQDEGLIRSRTAGTIAWIVIALLAVGIGVLTSVLLSTLAADKNPSKTRKQKMSNCIKCGTTLVPGAVYCHICGKNR